MNLKDIFTLGGYTLTSALEELDKQLPPGAYKPIPGAAKLTDINPAYMFTEINRIFGALGTGWTYEVTHNYEVEVEGVRSDGSTYTEWECGCRVELQYVTIHKTHDEKTGELVQTQVLSMVIPAEGGNANKERSWAKKGAETNALGAAWSRVGWQASVYKSERTHTKTTPDKTGAEPTEEPSEAPAEKPKPTRKRRTTKKAEPKVEPAPKGRNDDATSSPGLEEATNKSIVDYMQFVVEKGGADPDAVERQLNDVKKKYGVIPQEWVDHMLEQAKLKVRQRGEEEDAS